MNITERAVLKAFGENFSTQPKLFFSPGRINLIGEHLDYNDGFVMPAAIDKGIYYALSENGTDDIHFLSLDFKEQFSVNIHDIKASDGWRNYVLSVVNEIILAGKNQRIQLCFWWQHSNRLGHEFFRCRGGRPGLCPE